jgi:hypothetical protein
MAAVVAETAVIHAGAVPAVEIEAERDVGHRAVDGRAVRRAGIAFADPAANIAVAAAAASRNLRIDFLLKWIACGWRVV